MANMYVICLVLVLTVAVVKCTDTTCTTSTCTGGKTCKWICEQNGHQIANVTSTICTAADVPCAKTGSCKFSCQAASVNATCTSPSCKGSNTCKWTCTKGSDNTLVTDAYVTACKNDTDPCGSASASGTCKAACVQTHDQSKVTPLQKNKGQPTVKPLAETTEKNGSIRHGLSPLMLMCGIFIKLFLRL